LIRHARLALSASVLAFPVPMILPAFGTLLVSAVGAPSLLAAGGGSALRAAIPLSAITMYADPEHGVASIAAASPLTQNHFVVNRHARRRRGLDNGG